MTMHTYQEANFEVFRIIEFAERVEEIGKKWNPILFTDENMLYDIYAKTSMKMAPYEIFIYITDAIGMIRYVIGDVSK